MGENYCAIDFETACHNRASACAVGVVRLRNGTVEESLYSLIKPPEDMDILPFLTSIHGISMDQVQSAPTFLELWPSLKAFIGTDTLLAHNAPFDSGVLKASLKYYDLTDPVPPFRCTVNLARQKWPHLTNFKLNTICDYLGIGLNHHEALSDATACAHIFLEAAHV